MSLPDRLADAVTTYSKLAIVCMLVATLLIGAGASAVDDDSSLDQFESDSEEARAAEYVDENFSVEEADDTTSVQLVVTGENVLARESLLASLEFQETIRANETISPTLVDEDPITGVENLVAITAITEERAAELEARGGELETRSDELNETSDRLEAGIDDVRDLQREYDELNASYEAGDVDDDEYRETAASIESEIDAVVEEATAGLDDEQRAAYEEHAESARSIESGLFALEAEHGEDASDQPEYEALLEDLEDVYAGATMGVLEDEYDELEADSERLEEDRGELASGEYRPSLDEQIEALETLDDDEYEETLRETLSEDESGESAALVFMPSDYEPGSTEAESRMTSITQETPDDADDDEAGAAEDDMGGVHESILDAHLDLRELAIADEQEYIVFGAGVITDEIDRSMADSLAIVGPLALVLVVTALLVAYRDPLDIVLGVLGILIVLVWTFGFMGWAGIAFNQMFVAVPVLLIGLSIDYAIHVFMRHREQRDPTSGRIAEEGAGSEATREQRGACGPAESVRGSMTVALAGVGVALVWVTATTIIGFLSNLISPIGPIREFGIVSSFGILAALAVFAVLIPAAKVEIDSLLESWGVDRRKRAFGTGGGRFTSVLSVGALAARKAPIVVLVGVLVLTAGGVYGATQVDTSFEEEDFLAEDPPDWTEHLGPLSPGEYHAKEDMEFVNERFQRADSQAQVLVTGNVTDDRTLRRIATAEDAAADSEVVYTLPTGEPDVRSPLSVMERVAAENESFNESFTAADTTGDGVPDENVSGLYDELFAVDEAAASEVIDRVDGDDVSGRGENGDVETGDVGTGDGDNGDGGTEAGGDSEYEAIRLVIAIEGAAGFDEATEEMRAIASTFETGGGDGSGGDGGVRLDDADDGGDGDGNGTIEGDDGGPWSAIATGDPVVSHVVEQDLLETVLESLLIALIAVFAFLSVAYWITGNGATLGAVTLLPVAFSVSWILGTMYLVDMPFNVLTGMITSLTIGLGVAYSIHVSARYTLELDRQGNVWDAMHTTVTGTGGALLGSAATTIGGFGTLAFAILPVLRQFGIITGLTILYAFLASVLVLPSVLVLWTRYLGPDVTFDSAAAESAIPAASDGGRPDGATDPPPDDSEAPPDDATGSDEPPDGVDVSDAPSDDVDDARGGGDR